MRSGARVLALLLPVIAAVPAGERSAFADLRETGRRVYGQYCVGCHGARGDGKGEAASDLLVQPRDFTSGIFKFKSSRREMMPSDDDILKVLNGGVALTSMPSFRLLPDPEKRAVLAYIKTFSPKWNDPSNYDTTPFAAGRIPSYVGTPVSIGKGEEVFKRCISCHGKTGAGDGTSAKDQKDAWGRFVPPRNFTYGVLKRGERVEDIYQSITLGVGGTPMPPHETAYAEEDRWHLVSYVLTLMGKLKYETAEEDDDE